MSGEVDPNTNENVFELRFKPNPRILDHRGIWAELISDYMELKHWRILENRLDIFDSDQQQHAFVGFQNAGMAIIDSPNRRFFPEKAAKFIKYLFSLDDFGDPLHVERIGVRMRYCSAYNGEFETLKDLYASRYLTLTEAAKDALGKGCKLVDAGAPLNFVDKHGNFNTMSGPMTDQQLNQFFKKSSGFPKVAFYFDIDYWQRPNKELGSKEILSLLSTYCSEAWEKQVRIASLVMG